MVPHLHSATNSYKYTSTTINGLYTTIIYHKLMIANILPTFTSLITHSNVVAQLTKTCRPVGCCPVRFSPSCLSPSWFVAQMTVHHSSVVVIFYAIPVRLPVRPPDSDVVFYVSSNLSHHLIGTSC